MTDIIIDTGTAGGTVSGLLTRPKDPWALLVLAHGAGAGMRHPFMEMIAGGLADRGMATLRYQFPYMEQGTGRPDRPQIAEATVRRAAGRGAEVAPGLPLFAGGKSYGGRMTSSAAADTPLDGVRGLIFLGFPLHAPGKPGVSRAEHLDRVRIPMLFLQGTRDSLADLGLMKGVLEGIGNRAVLEIVEGGDHSFKVPRRSGRSELEVQSQMLDAIASFCRGLI